jgi:hypothetical protein
MRLTILPLSRVRIWSAFTLESLGTFALPLEIRRQRPYYFLLDM